MMCCITIYIGGHLQSEQNWQGSITGLKRKCNTVDITRLRDQIAEEHHRGFIYYNRLDGSRYPVLCRVLVCYAEFH